MRNSGERRVQWIDMAKGYGMILVILGHIGCGQYINSWIYTFHMPLFFFISGFLAKYDYEPNQFLNTKLKSIIQPYFCLGIPMLIFDYCYSCSTGRYERSYIKGLIVEFFLQRRLWTLWFLSVLWWLNLYFYVVDKRIRTPIVKWLNVFLLSAAGLGYYKLGGQPLIWNFDIMLTAMPFFAAGHYIYIYRQPYEPEKSISKQIAMIAALGAINVTTGYFSHVISKTSGLEMFGSQYGYEPLTFVSAFAGIGFIILISKLKTFKPIAYIGRNSLLYFAWHQTIFIRITKDLFSATGLDAMKCGTYSWYCYVILIAILVITGITVLNEIISRTKLRFMLGR